MTVKLKPIESVAEPKQGNKMKAEIILAALIIFFAIISAGPIEFEHKLAVCMDGNSKYLKEWCIANI